MMQTLYNYASHPTTAVFGVGVDGKPVILPFAKFPHALLAGTTGSGKSVFANNILISQMSHTHPDELKFSIVDPKIVEFARYARLPHMFTDPVTNMGDAYGLMTFFTHLMDRRYDIMKKADNNQNIDDYNQWIDGNAGEAKKLGVSKFCYHKIVIDEYSDMIMQVPEVEAPIIRLAQKARAAG
ncbi:FtsK/SpoIIIE domain-containing protein, partial [Corynebacterium mastitidis]|uniref:FtsK/SpoIIIE domain-containing protein n=1 Tax=Corynebacterium mastitidis TaxID=161890 RepID=UPI0024561566